MYLQTRFELSMLLDTDKFKELFDRALEKGELQPSTEDDTYVDNSLMNKGITVTYRDSQYKKRIKLDVNANVMLDGEESNPDNASKLIRRLEKRIEGYFKGEYELNDFKLVSAYFTTDIDVRDRAKAAAYLKVIQRVGKVKGFSPARDNWLDNEIMFALDGNSNGIDFMICNLETILRERLDETESERKKLKAMAKKAGGLLRAEVRLMEPKAIRVYADGTVTSDQIAALSCRCQDVFLDTFTRIVPFGEFRKKDDAVEIIRREVADRALRRRMLRLVELIPEKKSLLLAQKALNYRKVDDVMDMFGEIDLSPVTISKRHDVKRLENIYKYL